jgi:CubicO group peptidase (beta-lactamase class C family)
VKEITMKMSRRSTIQLLAGAGALGLVGAASPAVAAEAAGGPTQIGAALPEVERFIRSRLDRFAAVPGCAVAITRGTKIVWARSYGKRDLRAGRPFTLNTTHNIASITKTYMTTLMLALLDRGLVKLDRDVNAYLPYKLRNPYFPDVPITLRMLLSHTSGLGEVGPEPGPYADSYRAGDMPERDGEWARRCLALSTSERQYVYPPEAGFWLAENRPGELRSYSNVAWQVLTDVVRRVTGRDIHDRMRKLVLQPTGAHDSGFRLADAGDDQAMGYSAVIGGVVENYLPFDYEYLYSVQDGNPRVRGFVEYARYTYDVFADGGMRTSVAGLAAYTAMWANGGVSAAGRVLSKASVREAFTDQPGEGSAAGDAAQGLGWGVFSDRPDAWAHSGGDLGTNTIALVFPESKSSVVAISNVSAFPEGIAELGLGVAERAGI